MQISQEKLRKLKASADIIEKGDFAVLEKILEYEDFLEDFEEKTKDVLVLADKLEEIKQYCISNIELIDLNVKDTFNQLIGQIDDLSSSIKDKINKTDLNNLSSSIENKLSNVPKMSDIKALIATQISNVKDSISKIKTDISSNEIVNKLESIQEENEKLSIEAIKNLREELNKLKENIGSSSKTVYIGGGNSGGGRISMIYDLSPYLDGATKTFALPSFWRVTGVVTGSAPITLRPNVDYTTDASAMTITFTSEIEASTTLATGQTVLIYYTE